jgi:hypothetical protein
VQKYGRAGQATDDNMAHALHVGYLRLQQTHSEYMVLSGFLLHQWLPEGASMLRVLCSFGAYLKVSHIVGGYDA